MKKQIKLSTIKNPLLLIVFSSIMYVLKDFISIDEKFIAYIDIAINTMLIYAVAWLFYDLVLPLYQLVDKEQSSLEKLIIRILQILTVVIGGIVILHEWGYNISGFLASLGLLGMAFALAAKDTVSNLFGSFVVFTDKPFKVGDWIKTPDVEGTVEQIDIRSTKVRTFAQALVTVPNGTLANSAILNWSAMGKRRIKMNVGLTYSTTASQVENIVKDIKTMLENHEDIHQETMYIYFTEFGDSSLNIFCYFFTKTTSWGEFMRVKENTNLNIMKIVEQNNSSFAFPSQSIYIEQNKEIN